MTYEATIRVYAPGGLTDEEQRVWGDAMSDAESAIRQALADSGRVSFTVEAHGPERDRTKSPPGAPTLGYGGWGING